MPLEKKWFRPSGGKFNILQAAFISLVSGDNSSACRENWPSYRGLTGWEGSCWSSRDARLHEDAMCCWGGLCFYFSAQHPWNRLHSESLRKTDWLNEDTATTVKQFYTLSNCPQVILSTSREGFHKQNPVSEVGLDSRAGRHQVSHEGTSAWQPLS